MKASQTDNQYTTRTAPPHNANRLPAKTRGRRHLAPHTHTHTNLGEFTAVSGTKLGTAWWILSGAIKYSNNTSSHPSAPRQLKVALFSRQVGCDSQHRPRVPPSAKGQDKAATGQNNHTTEREELEPLHYEYHFLSPGPSGVLHRYVYTWKYLI